MGRFISRDILQYIDGFSMYGGYFIPASLDPTGLTSVVIIGPGLSRADYWIEWLRSNEYIDLREVPDGESIWDFIEEKLREALGDDDCISTLNLAGHACAGGIGASASECINANSPNLKMLREFMCDDATVNIRACNSGDNQDRMRRLGRILGAARVCGCAAEECDDCDKDKKGKGGSGIYRGYRCEGEWVCVDVEDNQ